MNRSISRQSMRALSLLLFLCAVIRAESPTADVREPGAAMILSTGDNLFYYKWFPIDSAAGIRASFEIFKREYNVDRIIWRGAQAQWMAYDNVFRPEAEEIADLYVLEMELETKHRLSHVGAEEARRCGLAYWGYMPFFEVGAAAEAVSMAGIGPYNFEEKIRAEHPEFRLYDRAKITSGSTIEFGYPEVRKRYCDLYDKMLAAGEEFGIYDGIIFYTYVENFFPRFSDQFIYSDVAARDFKQRYGVDVYTQPFDMDQYMAMRGEYVTQYLRELRQVFNKHGKKLAFYIDAREPEIPQRWPSYPDLLVPGRVKMDWRTWVKEGLIDEIALRSVTSKSDVEPFVEATKGTNVRLSILTNQMPPELRYLHASGVSRHIWSPELHSDFPKENRPVSDLASDDRFAVMSVLRQVRDGALDVPVEKLTALFSHPDLIVRRQAVAAVLGRRMEAAIPALERATMDPENSFRCVVIDALGALHGPHTVNVIGASLEKYPHMGTRIVARTAWSMMLPQRTDELVALYQQTKSPYVRAAIIELPVAKRAVPAVDAQPAFRPLVRSAVKDENDVVRALGSLAAANYPDRESAELLLNMIDDPSVMVQNYATFGLGEVARRIDDRQMRESIFTRLNARFEEFGNSANNRPDSEWGYRVAGESLLFGFGPRGHRSLIEALNGANQLLADRAWRVLFHPNDGWNFYPIEREAAEKQYRFHPNSAAQAAREKLPPLNEVVLLHQSFSDAQADPMGVIGTVWQPGGKWTGLDDNARFGTEAGKPYLELAAGNNASSAKIAATRAFDLPDGRFKNRLRGHFPSSPVASGVGDGVVELTVDVQATSPSAVLQIALKPDARGDESVGFTFGPNGNVAALNNVNGNASPLTLPATESSRVTLRLDFDTGQATVSTSAGQMQFQFDNNRQYRAVAFVAGGSPGSATRIADVKLIQKLK